MARIRSIKPEFFTSLTIGNLPPLARLTFIGLWTYVDDDGRGIDDERLIRAAVWPLDERPSGEIREDLRKLHEAGLITRYEVDGRAYLAITTWAEHQRVSHPKPSRYPAPEEGAEVEKPAPSLDSRSSREDSGEIPEDSGELPPRAGAEQGAGSREMVKETTPPTPQGGRKGKGKRVGLPDNWKPNEAHHQLAEELGVDIHHAEQEFRDWVAADGIVSKDWDARFRNSLRRQQQFARRGSGSTPNGNHAHPVIELSDEQYLAWSQPR